ncbi:hypothetical protein DQ04_04061030 [Trypanosoma grayi]|uniref:hypothetical protein n=1 Tax=Trypanosoma grayi TaxID=71804 RepID=UPI0004F40BC9|nr:hypothetical protein DQ04_04061030 [Trypanosoma grayi]KEG10193.1 hypothetical protein DQ04_04061030 [Trypanosoma grayi]
MLSFIGAIGTLLSTFMSADTLSHTFGVHDAKAGKLMLMMWILACCLSPWMSSFEILGWLHCAAFVASALKFGEAGLAYDFVRIPLSTFVPVFGILEILFNYAWSTA